MTRKELTDRIDKLSNGKINWGMIGRLLSTFTYEHISKCLSIIPDRVWNTFQPTDKVKYLWAICRKEASMKDYQNKSKDLPFNIGDFKL